ncbi:SPW repeat protein [Prescottella agglutinans]|uniref:Fatty acid desaturase n=1 Tax=Prescottella agglutinans TaxID=1644129 RepID=A0ABT6MDA5_9NOCA|nr:SPW repeat protein [Prescottella agglutinans]MDH6282298.1 fatty acid desaturase [Prescottella agglutinans]
MSTTPSMSMETHPDIAELRARYDEFGESPVPQLAEGLMVLAGLYAAASPWIIGFNGQTSLMMCNLLAGLAVALLAVGHATSFGRTHGIAFVAPLLGAWLIVSPWLVRHVSTSPGMIWSNVVVGAVVLVLGAGLLGMGMTRSGTRR